MQIIIALLSALVAATVDFANIKTVVPQDWLVPQGQGIQDCSGGKCLLSEKTNDKEVFAGVVFKESMLVTQNSEQLASFETIFGDLNTNYLSASSGKIAYDGVNILIHPDSSIYIDFIFGLHILEPTHESKLTNDNVIVTLSYAQYTKMKGQIGAPIIKAFAVKFATDPDFNDGFKLEQNVVCLADNTIGAKIYDAYNKQVFMDSTAVLHKLSEDVLKCVD